MLAVIGRPLLFASVDPGRRRGARASRSEPLSLAFLVLLGAAAAAVAQITGTLLVFALLVVPAATAQALTARPASSVALAVGDRPDRDLERPCSSPTTSPTRSGSS